MPDNVRKIVIVKAQVHGVMTYITPPPFFFHFFSHTLLNIILVSNNHKSTISLSILIYRDLWLFDTKITLSGTSILKIPSASAGVLRLFHVGLFHTVAPLCNSLRNDVASMETYSSWMNCPKEKCVSADLMHLFLVRFVTVRLNIYLLTIQIVNISLFWIRRL